jgi:hypothetical protein
LQYAKESFKLRAFISFPPWPTAIGFRASTCKIKFGLCITDDNELKKKRVDFVKIILNKYA